MIFRVGPWPYRLRVVQPERLCDTEGNELLGRSDSASREILISESVPPAHRRSVLLHELKHCWLFHFPKARTEEEDCNFTAAVAEQFYQDLDAQGGADALERIAVDQELPAMPLPLPPQATMPEDGPRYEPVDAVESYETTAKSSGGRAQCGRCETIVADGSIVNSPPRWDPAAGGVVLTRTLYCWHCNQLQRWVEGASMAGHPNGAVVSGPEMISGSEVQDFLLRHPNAVGLLADVS